MFLLGALYTLAVASSVFAAPMADSPFEVGRHGGWRECDGGWSGGGMQPWTNWTATQTVYVTINSPAGPETPSATAALSPSTLSTSGQFDNPQGLWSTAITSTLLASAPYTPTAPCSPTSVGGTDGSYISVVNEWRDRFGLAKLSQDPTLESNARKTADESIGDLKHQLNPGTKAQVLAPGEANNFEHVYVGGWLCEIPSAPALDGICGEESKGWDYQGQTGHAEILTSTRYSMIGCAHSSGTGVWCCDLA